MLETLGKWPSGKEWTEWDFVVHELFPNEAPDALPLISDKNGRAVPDTRIDPEGTGIASAFERDRWRDAISQKIHECEIAREAAMPAVQRLTTRAANIWQGARGSLPLVILPPLALLAIGWLLNWIARGFQASA